MSSLVELIFTAVGTDQVAASVGKVNDSLGAMTRQLGQMAMAAISVNSAIQGVEGAITAGLTVAWTQGWATWAINPANYAAYDFAAPLLFGCFKQPPTEAARNDDKVTVDFAVDEDSPAGYAFAPAAGLLAEDTTFATAGGFAAPIFPWVPEWSQPPHPGPAVVDVERTAIGPGRQKATTFYPQSPEQTHQASFRFKTAADAARLIAWWARRAGITDPHWVAGSQAIGKLSADVGAAATVLNFTRPIAPLGSIAYIALFDPAGRLEFARVQSSASQQITLAAGLQQAWQAAWTTIAPAMLARHTDDKLTIEYLMSGLPFWPADGLLEDLASSLWGGGLRVFYEPDWSAWQILAGASAPDSFTPSASCRTAPLLWGKFDKLPDPAGLTGKIATCEFTIVETGLADYAIKPASSATISGPTIGGAVRPLLPVEPDWAESVNLGGIDLRLDKTQIGYGRAPTEDYVSQAPRRHQKATLAAFGSEIMALLAHWRSVRNVGTWWAPGLSIESTLAVPASLGATQITLSDADALSDEWGIVLPAIDGTKQARKVSSRDGAVLTITPGLSSAVPAGAAVSALWLCRFSGDNLQFEFVTPTLANIVIEAIELPTEKTVPAGETVGTTIGDLGAKWWGYVVTDGTNTWWLTSYDASINAGALGVFAPAQIDHGDIVSELNLERHDVDLTVGWWAGSPFELQKLDRLAPLLTVAIYEGFVATPSAALLIFTGRAIQPKYSGAQCVWKLSGLTSILDVKGPLQVNSKRCWVPLYSPLCGLRNSVMGVDSDLIEIGEDGHLMFALAGHDTFENVSADHYRFGFVERTLSDGTKRRYQVAGNQAVTGDPPSYFWHKVYMRFGAGGVIVLQEMEFIAGGSVYPLNDSDVVTSPGNGTSSRINDLNLGPYVYLAGTPGTWLEIVVHTPDALCLDALRVYCVDSYSGNGLPDAIKVSTSLDGVNWTFRSDVAPYGFGAFWQTLTIPVASPADETLGVTIMGSLSPMPEEFPESGWRIYPGCDKSYDRCKALSNSDNFRGLPCFPRTNPAFVPITNTTATGSKK